jgi:arylsulfatase A-like enzyme
VRRLLGVACSLLLAFSAETAEAKRPNIVIFLADDLGYADPGYRGSGIETPTLDRLAAEGMDLTRFYVAPICSPTRAALMTGRDPVRLGVAWGVLLPWDSGGVHTREHFMPESFQAAGYQTAMVGKWHLGHAQEQLTPNARGFDEFYGHLHTEVGFFPPFSLLGGKDFQHNGRSIDDQGYETYLLADHASEWIRERDPEKPFFLYLPFLAPHEPLEAPDELVEKYADMEDEREPARSPSGGSAMINKLAGGGRRPLYAAVVDAMDQAMGRVMATLDAEGISDNTIVLFLSDNGASRMPGRGGGDNAPLRGGKAETYEGGIRVVSLLRWPEKIPANTRNNSILTVMDVFPTLAAAAGIPTLNSLDLDGRNMLPALSENKRASRDDTIFFGSEIPRYGSFNFAAITERWKLVQWVEQDPLSTTVRHELFDMVNDPYEYTNLAQEHPDKVQELAAEILAWRALYPINGTRARIGAPPGWHPPKDWADYPRPAAELQATPASSMAPYRVAEHLLDWQLGDRGRLIYNCEPIRWLGGICPPVFAGDANERELED